MHARPKNLGHWVCIPLVYLVQTIENNTSSVYSDIALENSEIILPDRKASSPDHSPKSHCASLVISRYLGHIS